MSSLKVNNIAGVSGGTSPPITLSGDTATLGSGVVMASSGVTVRNITQVAMASNATISSNNSEYTFFSPTYTPLFSGSKVQGNLSLQGFAKFNGQYNRKILKIEYTGNDITDITINNDGNNTHGSYDYGSSGVIIYFFNTITGPLITTTGTSTITANCKFKNEQNNSNSEFGVYGNNSLEETMMTWIEYR